MKKIFIFLLLLISIVAKSQVTALPQPSSVQPFGLLDVRSFGAKGDSTTDNTAAFRACFALAGFLHTGVFIPSGNWRITDSIIVAERVSIWGISGMINNNNELGSGTGELGFASTNILMQGNDKSVFVIDPLDTGVIAISNVGNTFKDFAIIYQGTTPTKNAGIRLVDGGGYTMENVSIANFWIDFDQLAASYTSMVGCRFSNYANIGMRVQNSRSADWGGTNMVNCHILTGKYSGAYAGLAWFGSGAFRMDNCEFNLTDLTHNTKYSLVLGNSGSQATQEIYINNTSLSAFDSCALLANDLTSLTKGIFINNVYAYGPITDSCNQAAFQFSPRGLTGAVQQIHLSNLTAASAVQNKFGYQVPVVLCTNCQQLVVTNITHGAYYTGADVNCLNCQIATQGVRDMGLNTGFQDANGQPTYVRIGSKYGLDLIINDTLGAVAQGNYGLRFMNGTGAVGGITTAMQFNLGQGNTATFQNMWPQIYSEKDTAGKVGLVLRNATAGATASIGITATAPNASFTIYTTTSTFTPFKNIRASSTAFEADGAGNLDILYQGGSLTMSDGALGTSPVDFAIKAHNVGIYTTGTPAALLDIGGSNYNNPNNAAGGNVFSIKSTLIQNTTTGVSGNVPIYAIAAIAPGQMLASNTGVTYTDATLFYLGGPPTDGTNVTSTRRWTGYVNSGAFRFGPATTSATSINIPSGTAPTSPNNGDVWYDGTHFQGRANGTTAQLDQQTFDQALSYGSTLTANRTVVNAGFTFAITGTGNIGLGTAALSTAKVATGIVDYNSTYGVGLVTSSGTSNDAVTAGSGTVATMGINRFQIPTLTATNTSVTYTNSYNVVIDGAPTAGTHVTQTNPWAFGVLAGNSQFGGHVETTGSAPAFHAGSAGTNVTSVTPTGTDVAMHVVIVTSGAVTGAIGSIDYNTAWTAAPHVVISCTANSTGNAAVPIIAKATSSTLLVLSGVFAGAGTFEYDIISIK